MKLRVFVPFGVILIIFGCSKSTPQAGQLKLPKEIKTSGRYRPNYSAVIAEDSIWVSSPLAEGGVFVTSFDIRNGDIVEQFIEPGFQWATYAPSLDAALLVDSQGNLHGRHSVLPTESLIDTPVRFPVTPYAAALIPGGNGMVIVGRAEIDGQLADVLMVDMKTFNIEYFVPLEGPRQLLRAQDSLFVTARLANKPEKQPFVLQFMENSGSMLAMDVGIIPPSGFVRIFGLTGEAEWVFGEGGFGTESVNVSDSILHLPTEYQVGAANIVIGNKLVYTGDNKIYVIDLRSKHSSELNLRTEIKKSILMPTAIDGLVLVGTDSFIQLLDLRGDSPEWTEISELSTG